MGINPYERYSPDSLPSDPEDSALMGRHNRAVHSARRMEGFLKDWTAGRLPSLDATEVSGVREEIAREWKIAEQTAHELNRRAETGSLGSPRLPVSERRPQRCSPELNGSAGTGSLGLPRLPMPEPRPQRYPQPRPGLVDGQAYVYDTIPGVPGYHQRTNIAGLPVRDTTIGGFPRVSPTMNGMPRPPAHYGPGGPPITGPGGVPLFNRGRSY